MKDFVIYSYQFTHLNDEPNLFIDIQKRNKELMENSIEGIWSKSVMPTLDQSFSTDNFEVIYNLLSRRGKVNIDKMPEPYKKVVTEIKSVNERR